MKKLILTLLATASIGSLFGLLTEGDDSDLVTHESTYTTHLATFNNLLELQGDDRTDNIGSLSTDLGTLATAITSLITANTDLDTIAAIATVGASYRTRIETLQTNTTNLKNRTDDVSKIGDMQQAIFDGMNALLLVKPETTGAQTIAELQTANAGHISTALTALTTQTTTSQAVLDAGVGEIGGLKTALSQTEFDLEFSRMGKTKQLADLFNTLPALNTSFLNALAGRPDIEDEGLSFYDTALTNAQTIIETAANNLKTDANLAAAKAAEIVATDTDEDTEDDDANADVIPSISGRAQKLAQNFASLADRQLNNSALTKKEIELRNLQRLLFFGDKTAAEKVLLREQIKAKYLEVLANSDALESSFATLLQNDSVPTIAFPETPYAPIGSKDGIEQLADKQTAAEVEALRLKIQILNDNQPPPPGVVEAGVTRLRPALQITSLAALMYAFTNKKVTRSAPKRLAAAEDRDAEYAILKSEWDSYLALANDAINHAEINKSRIVFGQVTNLYNSAYKNLSHTKIQDLFEETTPSDAAFAKSAKKALRFIKRLEGTGDNAVLVIMNEVATDLMSGKMVLEPTTTISTEPATAANTTAETNNTTFSDAGNLLDGENLTRSDLADDTSILIAGKDASLEDPVIGDAVDKLTANIKFYVKESGSIGLGAANVSTKSGGQSPNVLGGTGDESNSIQVIADGNCYIKLHSDIYVVGSKPIVPTRKFGQGAEHRITFFSEKEVALRIKKNVTWDLSAFGNTQSGTETGDDLSDTTSYTEFGKQIVFGGKCRLVMEPGAKIKFPNVTVGQESKGVVLYFNDEARMICEADLTNESRVFEGETLTGSDCIRNKIMGEAQIWFNKNAVWQIQEGAFVGIESSYDVPRTNLLVSLQTNACIELGTASTKGGALQIGNMFNGGSKLNPHGGDDDNFPNTANNSDGSFVPKKTFVNFELRINGSGCKFTIGRNAFFGIAAGTINKSGLLNTWQLQRLYNVGNCIIDVKEGTIEHSQISSGSDSSGYASLWAFGPLVNYPSGKYLFKMDLPSKARVRGGGNMLVLSRDANCIIDSEGALVAAPHTVSVGSSVTPLTVDNLGSTNTGRYGIMAPGYVIRSNGEDLNGTYQMYGRAFVSDDISTGRYIFAGPQEEMFEALTMPDIITTSSRYRTVAVGYSGSDITGIDGSTSAYAYAYRAGNTLHRRSTKDIAFNLIDQYTGYQLPIKPEDVLLNPTDGAVLKVKRMNATTGKPETLTTV